MRHGLVGTVTCIVVLTALALPVAALVAVALARRRMGAGRPPREAWRRSVAEVGLVHGTVPAVGMTLAPGSVVGAVAGGVSLVPLRDLATMSTTQVVGNLVLLAAVGLLAPVRFPSLASTPRVLALAAACSVLIEGAQYGLGLDRVSSVDDVLLNTAGAGLATLASRPWRALPNVPLPA